ncbi:MAG: ATP-binding protein [Streptosporangiaceae bacterium]|nr:ATP-binding protein [Streptosporangiaceae bacterium]
MSTPQPPESAAPEDLRALARGMRQLFELAAQTLTQDAGPSPLALRVIRHLRCDLTEVVLVSQRFATWEHVNLQRGVDAYLAAHSPGADWFGPPGAAHQPHQDMLQLLSMPVHVGMLRGGPRGPSPAGAVVRGGAVRGDLGVGVASYGTAAIGPAENTEVVALGLVTSAAPDGNPVVIGLREFGPQCLLEILAADRSTATATRDEIERLMRANDVFRGQVLSFTASEHHGNSLVTFLPRPAVAARDVVLPDGMLEHVERHIIGIADLSAELLGAGQHLKRGLLLHGPPGTGKTHTVRYLTGRLTGSTVILLTGRSIQFIDQAAALARRLQPSMVVLEDVDLVAVDRDFTPNGNPLLFSLLDAMDGIGADADVTFVLTTNRADILETALADRPGRVDLAVEIPRPDARCRERLLRVYSRDLAADADLGEVVAGTEGVTASFIKEMIRRVVLVSLRAGERPPVLRGPHFAEVLGEMNGEHQALTRSLLGAGTDSAEPARRGPGGPPVPARLRHFR